MMKLFSKIKEAILIGMAHLCFKQIKDKMEREHEDNIQEIIEYIQDRMEAGLVVNLIASPEFIEAKFALQSDPLPELPKIQHLTVVDEDE